MMRKISKKNIDRLQAWAKGTPQEPLPSPDSLQLCPCKAKATRSIPNHSGKGYTPVCQRCHQVYINAMRKAQDSSFQGA
jgi:hypothetical protein